MAPTRGIDAGNQLSFIGILDTLGFFNGTSGSVASGATGEPMRRLLGIKRAAPGPKAPEFVQITGDDTALGAIDFGPNETPSWEVEVAPFDLDLDALLQTTLVENLGGLKIGVLQPNSPTYPDCCLIYQSKSKYKDTGSDGVKAWSGYIIPVATMVPLGRAEFNERTAGSDRFQVVAQIASRKPWGVTILEAVNGTDGAPLLRFSSDYPIVMERFTGDNATATFNLNYTPVSAAKTIVHSNTQLLVPSSVSAVNKTFTLASNPPTGAKVIALYEFVP